MSFGSIINDYEDLDIFYQLCIGVGVGGGLICSILCCCLCCKKYFKKQENVSTMELADLELEHVENQNNVEQVYSLDEIQHKIDQLHKYLADKQSLKSELTRKLKDKQGRRKSLRAQLSLISLGQGFELNQDEIQEQLDEINDDELQLNQIIDAEAELSSLKKIEAEVAREYQPGLALNH